MIVTSHSRTTVGSTQSDTLRWHCNGCGKHAIENPDYCSDCGSPRCPECHRPNSLVCYTEMARMVSQKISTNPRRMSPSRSRRRPGKSIDQLKAELGIK